MRKFKLENNVNIQIIKSDKFKTDHIAVRYVLDLSAKKASARSLLAMMLTNRTAKYPTNKELTNYLDMNYGINVFMNTYSLGGGHLLDVRTSAISDLYIENDSLNKQLDLIDEVVFNPLVDSEGLFDDELFEEAKMILLSKITRRNDDPATYAMDKACKLFGKGSLFSVSVLGSEEQVQALTKEMVKDAYYDMLHKARVDVTIISSLPEDEVESCVRKHKFAYETSDNVGIFYDYKINDAVSEEETRRIDQTSLILGWYSGIKPIDDEYYALKLANIIIGGDSTSFMFQEIREKNSLCYNVYSSVFSIDGFMVAYAGISYENKDKTAKMMRDIIEEVKKGEIDEQLETAKLLYCNSLLTQYDSASGMLNFEYQQNILGLHRNLDEVIDRISAVTKEQVIDVVNRLTYLGEFTLKEVNDNE
ncbi:MAG: insulinase family protein [Erysipelotrichales bacterium]|nr:insulinase family protein [Erysipelotrichales bacterium]